MPAYCLITPGVASEGCKGAGMGSGLGNVIETPRCVSSTLCYPSTHSWWQLFLLFGSSWWLPDALSFPRHAWVGCCDGELTSVLQPGWQQQPSPRHKTNPFVSISPFIWLEPDQFFFQMLSRNQPRKLNVRAACSQALHHQPFSGLTAATDLPLRIFLRGTIKIKS